jgi:hypothetical protein
MIRAPDNHRSGAAGHEFHDLGFFVWLIRLSRRIGGSAADACFPLSAKHAKIIF